MIPLVESFYSFQGEGRFVGSPSIFIRLGGCNLGCMGFGVEIDGVVGCDSLKAVHEKKFAHTWQKVDDLISIINQYLKDLDFKPDIVFTGGEPLLYPHLGELIRSIPRFRGSLLMLSPAG